MKTLLATLVAFTFSVGSAFAAVGAKDTSIHKPSVTKSKSHVKAPRKAGSTRAVHTAPAK